MAGVPVERLQAFQVTGVSEGVQIENRFTNSGKPVEYKICADEACAAGDENHDLWGLGVI